MLRLMEHAPIGLSIIEGKDKKTDSRIAFAVAKNLWTDKVIDQIEVKRMIKEEKVFKPYFSAQVGLLNTTAYGSVFRHNKPRTAFGLSAGYDFVNKEPKIGVAYSFQFRWKPR